MEEENKNQNRNENEKFEGGRSAFRTWPPVLGGGWDEVLKEALEAPSFEALGRFLEEEYRNETIYPPKEQIFRAFRMTPYREVRAVLLGQDPYHEEGQAEGLSFSVAPGVPQPPSLRNLLKERETDLGIPVPPREEGSLLRWAEGGVLLLNTVLTVRKGQAASHHGKGWEAFTDAVIRAVSAKEEPVVFLLFGKPAGQKVSLIDDSRHLIITAPHPSPLSAYRGFFGGKYYSRTNAFLEAQGRAPIPW